MTARFTVKYHVRSSAVDIETRAHGIAVEQSVEMPLAAIQDAAILSNVVAAVEGINDLGDGLFAVRIGLATETVGHDAGQFLNMIFGNTSLHEDVVLKDVIVPDALVKTFGGPRHDVADLRRRLKSEARALTGSALKPQGMSPEQLGSLAADLARGGLDFIKDDHGLADQSYSRFSDRIAACAAGVADGARSTGHPTRYIPSVTGDLDQMRLRIASAVAEGLDCVMIAPMICGFSAMQTLRHQFPDVAIFAHPSMGGAARIAPELLVGSLFRLMGADAVIFPSFGGRFGYSRDTCRHLAQNVRRANDGMKGALPVPAGGMTLARTQEILDFYGRDTMLLIGGDLLLARNRISEEAERFVQAVRDLSVSGEKSP
jgi:ribulose-bisphosphate carboxylase large chain